MKIIIRTDINRTLSEVSQSFNLKLFKALKPPFVDLQIPRFDGCQKDDEVHLKIKFGPLRQDWISLITEQNEDKNEWYFIDEGRVLPPPLKQWKHKHRVMKTGENSVLIIDDIFYSTENRLLDFIIYPPMYIQFWLRKPAYKKFFKDN